MAFNGSGGNHPYLPCGMLPAGIQQPTMKKMHVGRFLRNNQTPQTGIIGRNDQSNPMIPPAQ